MPKFIIEREIPGAGYLTSSQLEAIIQGVWASLGPQIEWEQSYLTNDKIYCIYSAPNKDIISEHARNVGIPANTICEIKEVIDRVHHPMGKVHEAWYFD